MAVCLFAVELAAKRLLEIGSASLLLCITYNVRLKGEQQQPK